MNRLIFRRILPVGAVGGIYALGRKNERKNILAKTEMVYDEFGTVKFWNEYKKVKIYGYQGCPYCAKVRAYLNFRGIDFEDVEVNAFSKSELTEVSPGYSQVPVVEILNNRGQQEAVLKDSGVIISVLEQVLDGVDGAVQDIAKFYFNEDGKCIKDRVFKNAFDQKMDPNRQFVQDGILHTIAPNIYPSIAKSISNSMEFRTRSEKYRDSTVGWLVAFYGGIVMYFVAYICIFRKYRESPDQTHTDYLHSQVEKFLQKRDGARFLGGDAPSVADVEAYGVVNLTEGTSAFEEYSKNPEFFQWYKSVEHHVLTHQGMKEAAETPLSESELIIEPIQSTQSEKL